MAEEFLNTEPASVIGQLAAAQGRVHSEVAAKQIQAWRTSIEALQAALSRGDAGATAVVLEFQMHRLRKRLDAVVLVPGVVVIVEFKVGSDRFTSADRAQAEDYALSLRDFHRYAQQGIVAPILCATAAACLEGGGAVFEGVSSLAMTGISDLDVAIGNARALGEQGSPPPAPERMLADFLAAPYRPTPHIIEAARNLYAGHQVKDIGRGGAADEALEAAANTLTAIVRQAKENREHRVCFVTGSPGAGKTLLGLNLAIVDRDPDSPAALLTGNRPLAHVLIESLTEDAARRNKTTKGVERRAVRAAIQNLTDYLREHISGEKPPEHVLVFDEAQRAWDAKVGSELMQRAASEPELFLEILSRLDWCCLVCLVGPGQEINRGEGGLRLWGEALSKSVGGVDWKVHSAREALEDCGDLPGLGLPTPLVAAGRWTETPHLDLGEPVRHHRNTLYANWVAALVAGDITQARLIANDMATPPALLTRSLLDAKRWLHGHARGGRSVGLLASSGAVRLQAEGLPPTPQSRDLNGIGHWFLKPADDYRSSGALEVPLSEFGCQGLEVDYAGLCWGNDLIWSDGWAPRKMRAPRWTFINDQQRRAFRLNAYRVLLTRARAGIVIYVPLGTESDATRLPADFQGIWTTLRAAGAQDLDTRDELP
ncbi:DUF2075 domain-containing protein [Nocardioides dongxiaopingii]|uniref:DNA/RNA helicase domain-containing protein n=1 Tax=Nocardioides sp. S-1144 TaxID=2582905 RepID=UPI001164D2A7|nr:DNA/RNA helicase domain-containing protein [Nocardioides sp. S-1144]QDH10972.1 DUF2075 domain-containing protein [Nocardioides sp. S-1144]